MVGFMAGVTVQIVLGQLIALTGFESAYANKVESAADLVAHAGRIDLPTTLVGLATVALILLLMRSRLRLFAMATAQWRSPSSSSWRCRFSMRGAPER